MRVSLILALLCALFMTACSTPARYEIPKVWQRTMPPPTGPTVTPEEMRREVKIYPRLIARGSYGRRYNRPMQPRYITIHATENRTGGAFAHAAALQNGKLRAKRRPGGNRIGFLTWHFTVQEDLAVQHLPTTEQGEHADFDGPGNNYSIGIEMCEHRGNDLSATIDRTAKLAAYLMYEHHIPLKNVVPHYHWPRHGVSPEHKNCPHFLLDKGRPGRKWQWFQSRVQAYYSRIASEPVPAPPL